MASPTRPPSASRSSRTLARAERLAAERRFRLTPVRRRVLELLAESDQALGAYDLLPHLQADGLGSQPVVAYRALEFLIDHGLAHRIEGMNAFVACAHPAETHVPAFLVCRTCRAVTEDRATLHDPELDAAARRRGFVIERRVVEALGLCAACRSGAPKTGAAPAAPGAPGPAAP